MRHATDRLPEWQDAWRRTGALVLLLDFDGTLAPIVVRPEDAALPERTRGALQRLRQVHSLTMAVVSGRAMDDAREKVGLLEISYAGNHGMEIDGPGVHRIHDEAAHARPSLAAVAARLRAEIGETDGAEVEDKQLTLSIHYRRVSREQVEGVRQAVFTAAGAHLDLRVTEGKEVLEVRPAVEWDKGRAVEFLLRELAPPAGTPAIYIGDDRTDEDAFRVLRELPSVAGEGVIVGDPAPATTYASSMLRDPDEVAQLLEELLTIAPEEREEHDNGDSP